MGHQPRTAHGDFPCNNTSAISRSLCAEFFTLAQDACAFLCAEKSRRSLRPERQDLQDLWRYLRALSLSKERRSLSVTGACGGQASRRMRQVNGLVAGGKRQPRGGASPGESSPVRARLPRPRSPPAAGNSGQPDPDSWPQYETAARLERHYDGARPIGPRSAEWDYAGSVRRLPGSRSK